MADTLTNRGKFRITTTGAASMAWRVAVITGNATGVHDVDINTVADLDALNAGATGIGTERLIPASVTTTEDDVNDRVNIDCANLTFAPAPGVTAVGLVFYHETAAVDSSREVVTVHTTGFPQGMDGGLLVTVNDLARLT